MQKYMLHSEWSVTRHACWLVLQIIDKSVSSESDQFQECPNPCAKYGTTLTSKDVWCLCVSEPDAGNGCCSDVRLEINEKSVSISSSSSSSAGRLILAELRTSSMPTDTSSCLVGSQQQITDNHIN